MKKTSFILKELIELKTLITEQKLLWKEVLNFTETAQYLGLSQSYLYQMVSKGTLPHYKPNGKKLYFNRQELDQWLLSNKQHTSEEIEEMALDFLTKKRRTKQ